MGKQKQLKLMKRTRKMHDALAALKNVPMVMYFNANKQMVIRQATNEEIERFRKAFPDKEI